MQNLFQNSLMIVVVNYNCNGKSVNMSERKVYVVVTCCGSKD